MDKCVICNEEIKERSHFWKTHKIKEADYYHKYFPRKDLLTEELIPFKSAESYQLTDFKDKRNLKKYLESIDKVKGLNYLMQWLLRRKEAKNLIYAPSNFELRTLCFPSIKFMHEFYGKYSYENICNLINLKVRYNYNQEIQFDNNIENIFVDTREQSPYIHLEFPIEIKTLSFGDYCSNPNLQNIFIERKELGDWCGVMSKSHDRFKREIQRAKENNSYLIILIEAKYSDLSSIEYLPQTKWVKASSEFLMKRARDLYNEFDNFQMVAGGTRKECIELFNKIIKIKNIRQFDIQYLIDCNKI